MAFSWLVGHRKRRSTSRTFHQQVLLLAAMQIFFLNFSVRAVCSFYLSHKDGLQDTNHKSLESPTTLLPPAPYALLQLISYTCARGCSKNTCTSCKSSLRCSSLCRLCLGTTCQNAQSFIIDDIEDMEYLEPSNMGAVLDCPGYNRADVTSKASSSVST